LNEGRKERQFIAFDLMFNIMRTYKCIFKKPFKSINTNKLILTKGAKVFHEILYIENKIAYFI